MFALIFAFTALTRDEHDIDEFYRGIDWDLIFFITLFMVISVMKNAGVITLMEVAIAGLINLRDTTSSLALLWASAIASSVTDSTPLSAMLEKIFAQMECPTTACCGSAPTVAAVTLMHKLGAPLSFIRFVTKTLIFAILQ